MPVFADRMKNFTDHLRISIDNRTDALGQVHKATNHLLTAARSFMGSVAHERQLMAGELHEVLDQFHGDLTDRVEDMRQRHRDSLRKTQAELRERLDDTKAARNESVKNLRQTFRDSRQEVADDLRAASQVWREFTVNGRATEPHEPAVKRESAAQTVKQPAPPQETKTQRTKAKSGTTQPKGRKK